MELSRSSRLGRLYFAEEERYRLEKIKGLREEDARKYRVREDGNICHVLKVIMRPVVLRSLKVCGMAFSVALPVGLLGFFFVGLPLFVLRIDIEASRAFVWGVPWIIVGGLLVLLGVCFAVHFVWIGIPKLIPAWVRAKRLKVCPQVTWTD